MYKSEYFLNYPVDNRYYNYFVMDLIAEFVGAYHFVDGFQTVDALLVAEFVGAFHFADGFQTVGAFLSADGFQFVDVFQPVEFEFGWWW